MKTLAIFSPTYNEKDNITEFIETVKNVVTTLPINTTIIIIDDNSPDGTGDIADSLAKKYSQTPFKVEVIHRKGKLGLATAYITAFKKFADKDIDYFLTMDADLSHNPKYIPDFLEHAQNNDLVIGSRNVPGGTVENWSLARKFISKGGSFYSRIILGVPIKDFTGGYNLYRKKIFDKVKLDSIKSRGYSFQIEMKYRIAKAGFRFKEIPIVFPDRKHGKSKMMKKIFFEALLRVWQIRFSNN